MEVLLDKFNSEFNNNKNFTDKELNHFLKENNVVQFKGEILKYLVCIPIELYNGTFVYIRKTNPSRININYIQLCNMILELEELRKGKCDFDSNFDKVMSEIASCVRINCIPEYE